jgi:hypothetical protein
MLFLGPALLVVRIAIRIDPIYKVPRYVCTPRSCFLAIVACARNEAPYIAEWLEFHLLVGVDKIFIINNRSEDNLTDVVRPYVRDGVVEYSSDNQTSAQWRIYGEFLARLRFVCTWICFLDCDEFIVPISVSDVPAFLRRHPDAAGTPPGLLSTGSCTGRTGSCGRRRVS